MGTKFFSDELPVHKTTVDTWTTNIINTLKGQANGLAPLGVDGLIDVAYLPPTALSTSWGNIGGTITAQTDLMTLIGGKAGLDSPAFTGTPTIGGVPIDISAYGIITGSNANGYYAKFPDGTLICWRYSTANQITDSTFGVLYVSASQTLTFPIAFVGALPSVMPTCTGNYEYTWAIQMTAPTLTYCKLSVVSSWGLDGVGNPGYTAIGRWK